MITTSVKIREYIQLSFIVRQELEKIATNEARMKEYELIGSGMNATVFNVHGMALKVYDSEYAMIGDAVPLKILKGSIYFPELYARCPERFVLMEYIPGKTLKQYALEKVTFKSEWFNHLERALKFALSKGVSFEDLHLENVIIRDNIPVIVDVGDYYAGDYKMNERALQSIPEFYEKVLRNPNDYN
ncbi:hypothetical protein P9597_30605 [Aneurinibacillus migulanus]|uniref:hypothetical protein n=1 Tax=Aneurinibacillus migulanus TaxID=47500 RepID=UPI002E24B719|nr:hypothetical protein [Aneurinibacillus migulanus]